MLLKFFAEQDYLGTTESVKIDYLLGLLRKTGYSLLGFVLFFCTDWDALAHFIIRCFFSLENLFGIKFFSVIRKFRWIYGMFNDISKIKNNIFFKLNLSLIDFSVYVSCIRNSIKVF